MEKVLSFFTDYFVADVCIALVGLYGFTLVLDRVKALYYDYAMPAEPFMKKVMSLLHEDKVEEALTFCSAHEQKPLAYIIKRILERSDRDERSMEHALEIAAAETAPKFVKNLGHLAMVSNVVTLIGLFGTVIGLIVSFKAISFADAAQKQTILAQGISIAMTATAMGLMVAIPAMFVYSFLYAKQARLFAEIDEHSSKVIDLLRSRAYQPFHAQKAYPSRLHVPPPPPNNKIVS